ncbi:hypothetical protein WN48_10013 [Eufriesea mexicana]|uniref:Uncharacterized protein n=1 Tax=Eufriesea mexicana TaxID=516756 RepID=A0A310S6X5_9HYME|nr:hypothetical protein WN48_10013 [Eufriesea mexicana]
MFVHISTNTVSFAVSLVIEQTLENEAGQSVLVSLEWDGTVEKVVTGQTDGRLPASITNSATRHQQLKEQTIPLNDRTNTREPEDYHGDR